MSLYRKGRIWYSSIWFRGIRRTKSTRTPNRRLAEAVDQEHKHEVTFLRRLAPRLDPEMPFEELAARFRASAALKNWHVGRLKFLLLFFKYVPIGGITKNLVLEYQHWRHTQKKVSESTVKHDLQCLKHMLFWAVDEGLLASNCLSRVPLPRVPRKCRPIMSVNEERELLAAAAPHLQPIIIMALDTGMRRGEILNQRWEGIDFGRGVLSVTRSKTPEGEAREIPLTDRLFNLLWESRENEGVIVTFKARPITSLKSAWWTALRRSGIRHYRFHDLRHTFNCRLLEAGVLREIRMALMGHASGQDVHAAYVHIELPQKREAIRRLQAWVATQKQGLPNWNQRSDSALKG